MNATLVDRIENKDWDLVETEEQFGTEIVAKVIPLLKHDDAQVRELTVNVLGATEGEESTQALFGALADSGDVVRALAMSFIEKRATHADRIKLARTLESADDEYLREKSALLLGKLGDAATISILQRQLEKERYAAAEAALRLALARLGDKSAIAHYAGRFDLTDVQGRVDALLDMPYVGNLLVVRRGVALLSDKRDAINVGPSHGPFWVRVCDVAVNSFAELLSTKFPFPVNPVKNYTDEELAAASHFLHGEL